MALHETPICELEPLDRGVYAIPGNTQLLLYIRPSGDTYVVRRPLGAEADEHAPLRERVHEHIEWLMEIVTDDALSITAH
ncbi:MAG: hypothetical protein LLP51_05550 [Halorhodospira halophila]|uniref:hypothetical protein n=1 Tax=Halorhodospira halophila TaxID=1053 RepID=UPI0026F01891|nr:hypothetical protein [Halorhodospira halophila]MCC3750844.1 hypothetical protein [Halorhodospira halophila]